MTLTLTPEAESLLRQEMAGGRFDDESQLIETALLALRDYQVLDLAALDEAIQEGIDSVDRGEVYTPEEAKTYLAAERAKW